MEKELKATLKEAISEKSGKPYLYVSLMLTPTFEMKVFLKSAEVELVKYAYNMEKTK